MLLLNRPMEELNSITLLGNVLLHSGNPVKRPTMNKHHQPASAATLHTPVLPRLPGNVLRLLSATYAAHGGAQYMSLDAWRDIEQELKRRLKR